MAWHIVHWIEDDWIDDVDILRGDNDDDDDIFAKIVFIRRDEWGWGSWQTAWAPDRGPSFDQDNDDDFEGVDDIETLCLSISIIWWTSSLTQL